jgi:hypothetical protein
MEEHDEAYWLQHHVADTLARLYGEDDPAARTPAAVLRSLDRNLGT